MPAVVETPGRVQSALAFEFRDGPLRRLHRDRARLPGKRRCQKIPVAEHRLAFGKVLDRPASGLRAGCPRSVNRSGAGSFRSARRAFARTVSAENPISAAWRSQDRRSSPRSTSRFAARVISVARAARCGLSPVPPRPCSLIAASISDRRVENSSITSRDTPAISNRPSGCVFSIPYPRS